MREEYGQFIFGVQKKATTKNSHFVNWKIWVFQGVVLPREHTIHAVCRVNAIRIWRATNTIEIRRSSWFSSIRKANRKILDTEINSSSSSENLYY
jgi:hypothetical protein